MSDPESVENIETKRKRLIFRSWHRGTREMDLILGSFADRHVPKFTAEELAQYEEVLRESDPDLYGWITGRDKAPANRMCAVLEKILAHRYA